MPETEFVKIKDEEIISLIDADLAATREYVDDLSDLRESDYAIFRGAPYPGDSTRRERGWSTTVSTVVQNAVNWSIPGLVEIFSDDFFTFRLDNSELAEDLKDYVRKVWYRQNDGEKKNDAFLHDCLTVRTGGVMKVYYKEEYDLERKDFERISQQDFEMLVEDERIKIVDYKEIEVQSGGQTEIWYEDVEVAANVTKYKGPAIDVVDPASFAFSPEALSVDKARLVWHRTRRNLDYVRRMENAGIFKKGSYKKALDAGPDKGEDRINDVTLEEREIRYWIEGLDYPEEGEPGNVMSDDPYLRPANDFWMYEIYTRLDVNKDGLLEDVIITMTGNLIFSVVENPFKRPPFRIGKPFALPHQWNQDTYAVMLENEQKTMTNLLRMSLDASAQTTYRNPITNDNKLFHQLKNRGPNTVLRGDPEKVGQIEAANTNQFILKELELMQGDIENKSGITRYNQGLDADSLNKTRGGMAMIMTASQQRQRLYARRISWTMRDVIYDIVKCLQLYPTPEFLEILQKHQADSVKISIEDISVDVGVSAQEKFATAQQLDALVQFQLGPGLQMGVTPNMIYDTLRKRYSLVGIDVESFLPSEEELEEQQRQQQAEAMAGGAPQGAIAPGQPGDVGGAGLAESELPIPTGGMGGGAA